MDKRRSCANCSSTDHHVSTCPTYKQGMKAIGFSLEDEDASELDHEDFMRGVIRPKEGHFKSFATWKVILNQISRNSGMQWQTSSIQDLKKLCQE